MNRDFINYEALRIVHDLSSLQAPNSPSGTHYAVRVSDEFAINASSKDQSELLEILLKKVKDISFQSMSGIPGFFAVTKNGFKGELLKNGTTRVILLDRSGDYALLVRQCNVPGISDPTPYIVAWKLEKRGENCTWGQGHYLCDIYTALTMYIQYK